MKSNGGKEREKQNRKLKKPPKVFDRNILDEYQMQFLLLIASSDNLISTQLANIGN